MTTPGSQPLRIGLTGGIASGKSTVAAMFAELGVPIIDTDVIAREMVQPGAPALEQIRRVFGSDVIAAGGGLDRAAMRRLVFADDSRRSELEAILHPLIREATWQQAAAAGGDYQIIVVPLLAESPMRERMDRILVVDVPEELQLARLRERDAEAAAQARRMMRAQASRSERLACADDVLKNDGSIEDTRRQVQDLHERYLQLARDLHGRSD